MRYAVAWLLGVPLSVIVVWYVVSHMLLVRGLAHAVRR